jgi:hypothetical protein
MDRVRPPSPGLSFSFAALGVWARLSVALAAVAVIWVAVLVLL